MRENYRVDNIILSTISVDDLVLRGAPQVSWIAAGEKLEVHILVRPELQYCLASSSVWYSLPVNLELMVFTVLLALFFAFFKVN